MDLQFGRLGHTGWLAPSAAQGFSNDLEDGISFTRAKRAPPDSVDDHPAKRCSIAERFGKLRIREPGIDDVILPFKQARLSEPTEWSPQGDFQGYFRSRSASNEAEPPSSEDEAEATSSSSSSSMIPSQLYGEKKYFHRVDYAIDQIIRKEYLRTVAQQEIAAGAEAETETEAKTEEDTEPYITLEGLDIGTRHAGDVSHSDWFFDVDASPRAVAEGVDDFDETDSDVDTFEPSRYTAHPPLQYLPWPPAEGAQHMETSHADDVLRNGFHSSTGWFSSDRQYFSRR